jgi:hypothetical protein
MARTVIIQHAVPTQNSIKRDDGEQLSSYCAVNGARKRGTFLGEHISLKMGHFAPFLATIQPLSKARAFLLGK